MKIRMLMLFGVLVIASMVLAACGGAATTETPVATEAPATEAPTTEEAPTAPSAPAGTLRIWADDTRAPILQDLADEVLATYNLELIVELKSSIRDDFQVAAPLGEGPDIFVIAHDQAGTLVANGLLASIDLGDKAADFAPQALEACTFDGILYCLPYATENLGFFYNTELVPTPPTTWEEVVSMGEALKAEGKVDYIMSITGTTYDLYPLYTAFGGYIFGKDNGNWNPQDLGMDSPGMIEAVKWVADNVANGNLPADWDNSNNRALFEGGKTPFIMDGPWSLSRFRDAGVPYAITKFPGDGSPFAGTQGFFINAQSENVLLAQAFLNEFIANEETMLKLYEVGQRAPAYLPALAKVEDSDIAALAEAGENATMMPAIPEMGSVWGNWNDAVILARDGKQDPETAMKEGAQKIRDIISNKLAGMVNVAGSYQAQAGCSADWQPDCEAIVMVKGDDGLYHSGPFNLKAGDYEGKVALDGGWTINYGVDGKAGGDNYKFTLAADGTVEFVYDPATNLLEIVTK
jgi:maltose-binding protein MalE